MSLPLATWLLFAATGAPAAAPSTSNAANACPSGMRLVEGDHYDRVDYECNGIKWGMCASYKPGFAQASGKVTHERVCMDEFEAPNVRGQKPMVMLTASQATAWCADRGKRLCTEYEWETACEGPEKLPYGYGWSNDGTCNFDKPWRPPNLTALFRGTKEEEQREIDRLWQGEPSGTRDGCVSAYGVHDMVGNVEEWITSSRIPGNRIELAGGHWAKSWSQCRDTNFAHIGDPAFTYYEVGLRCCEDPR